MKVRNLVVALILLGAGTVRADLVRILDDDREATQIRIDLIQQARAEIHAMYFLARNDRVTLTHLALLRDARRRGVGSVKLLVDANFHRIPKALLAHLRDEGVEVRVYHPFKLQHPSWLFRRMHDKVMIVDRARYITGGRNLAESYFGMGRKNYVDRDVFVEGASAAAADRHFESVWSSPHVVGLKVRVPRREKEEAAGLLDEVLRRMQCDPTVAVDTNRQWLDGAREVGAVSFLHDPTGSTGERVGVQIAEILATAKSSIVIESPYLVPSRSILRLLERKLAEGVYVQIVTNSLRSTDGVFPQAAYIKYRRRLVRAGMDIREYKGPHALHAKTVIVDGRIVLIGTYNIDPRSENLNTEVMCVADDREFAREAIESVHAHAANSWEVTRRGRREPDVRVTGVSRIRHVGTWAARLLLPIVEGQL